MRISITIIAIQLSTLGVLSALPVRSQSINEVSVNVNFKNLSLKESFLKLENQTGYKFSFREDLVDKETRKVNLTGNNISLEQALSRILANTPFIYKQAGRYIMIDVKPLAADPGTITGQVFDASTNETLIGVSITVKGVQRSYQTGPDGKFTISLQPGTYDVSFRYIGFEEKVVRNVVVKSKQTTTVNTSMQVAANSLNEVVVIGYGTSTKSDLTGAVGTVKMGDMEQAPVRSFEEALAGRVAGVQVTSSEGQPGATADILIRGANSLTQDNSPLYVIDGFPIENPDNNIFNPSEIESISVLQDASATAIYGARGANGVIIITTKRGKVGEPVINYNGYYGFSKNIYEVPLMNAYEYLKLQYEINPGDTRSRYFGPITGTTPQEYQYTLDDYKDAQGIDWQHQLFQTAPMQSHSLSMSGGTPKTRYSISGQLFEQEGTIINSGYKRYQGKITLDQTVSNKLKVGGDLRYTNSLTYGSSTSDANNSSMNNFLYSVWGYRPLAPLDGSEAEIIDEDTDDFVASGTDYRFNPIKTAQNQLRNYISNNLIGNAYAEYTIIKGLKFKTTGGINRTVRRREVFNNSNTYSGSKSNPFSNGPNGSIMYYETRAWQNSNLLTYATKIGKHKFDALAGFDLSGNNYSYYGLSANALPNESLGLSGLSSGTPQPVSSYNSAWQMVSGLARVNYSYQDKYYATASLRADASSKFAPGHQWSYFPSAALSWRINKEDFMKDLSFVSNAKLRLSWGATGNNRVVEYSTFPQMTYPITSYYSFNNELAQGIIVTNVGSPDLRWESTEMANIGLDLGVLKERFTLTVDYYKKNTKKLLLNAQLPYTTGYTSSLVNIGQTQNEGLEFTLNSTNIRTKDFTWSTNFNIAFNRNKVIGLTANQESLVSTISWDSFYSAVPLYIAKIGQPMGQIYGYIWDGVYQYDDFIKKPDGSYLLKASVATNGNGQTSIKPGDVKYRDINGDGVVNDFDRTVIGRAYPLHQGGFSNNFRYKDFDLNVFLQWSYGNDIVNANRLIFEAGNKLYLNQFATFENRWTPDNTDTDMPRAGGQYGYAYSTRIIEDGSFLRLKTVSLGYNLPKSLLQHVKVKSVRVYTSAQNLATWTKYSGSDPEVSVKRTALTPGFDYSAYPRARTITFGVNVSL
ncbi:TonB-dependent receptor [Pedobacter sp. BS3]|uniref:TonB-dependent receptor n=1 Tax=Pedobacter sp. BS3 TaxID=2567937 RepID=UPI0011EF76CA|nr:TonB-dependent receptor [Pedobacter sp. BS3]TZF83881.1 TonB-dependent receptor [Pedobacter sp. BS3]